MKNLFKFNGLCFRSLQMLHRRGVLNLFHILHHPLLQDLITHRCTPVHYQRQPTNQYPSFLVTELNPILVQLGQDTQAPVNHWRYRRLGQTIIGKNKQQNVSQDNSYLLKKSILISFTFQEPTSSHIFQPYVYFLFETSVISILITLVFINWFQKLFPE